MKVFLNIGFFIFVINGYLNPIFSFENTNHKVPLHKQTEQKNDDFNFDDI